jgi:hypothetical protein
VKVEESTVGELLIEIAVIKLLLDLLQIVVLFGEVLLISCNFFI